MERQSMFLSRKSQHHKFNMIPVKIMIELFVTKQADTELHVKKINKNNQENQDGSVGRHTAPPPTTRTDRESNSKGDRHQGNRK